MKKLLLICLTGILVSLQAGVKERPNILWITVEDMSPTLGCYGDKFAHSPFLDKFSGICVNYSNAFATAPVCSPSRSCLINGTYAQSQGTHQMRSAYAIPSFMNGFPALLRKAGYYTTNNVKTDYNSANFEAIIHDSWDDSSATADWQGRSKGQPFFSVINLMTTHQSRTMVWSYEKFKKEIQSKLAADEISDPAKVELPPYYPDTPVIRKTAARFYDCVTLMDKEVEGILAKLKADGAAENTIVFFYSDHGSGMPRHKRALLETGMKVPLMIHFPEKYRHLAPAAAGKWTDRLVSFVDFGPTLLSLLGIDVPDYMQGEPFLGDQKKAERQYVYGHRDRVDEAIDMSRSIRDKKYLYIRNFMPHISYNAPTAWPDLGDIRHEFYRLTDKKNMTPAQWHFAGPRKPVEELYDCVADPLNLDNLAGNTNCLKKMTEMRSALKKHILKIKDLGFLPESFESEVNQKNPVWDFARNSGFPLPDAVEAAFDSGTLDEPTLIKNLGHNNPVVRYWGAVGMNAYTPQISTKAAESLKKGLDDSESAVRIECASKLIRTGYMVKQSKAVLAKELQSPNMAAVIHAARTVELLGHIVKDLKGDMQKLDERMKLIRPDGAPATVVQAGDVDMAMFIGFSTNAFLSKVKAGSEWQDLFDGKTLNGWEARSKGQVVKVENGEIQLLSKNVNLWLVNEKEFENFELEVEAKMPESGYNSGIGFRCKGDKKPLGYQCEIDDKKSGAIYAIGKGWVLPGPKVGWDVFFKSAGDCYKSSEWNKFRIRCEGDHIQVWVNGHKTVDIKNTMFKKGQIALQHHGKGDMHFFRNIRVKEL